MMNKSLLIGRLTAKPELNKTASKKSVVRFRIAVNRIFKNTDGEREADFISVVIWGKPAELFTSYADKGSLVSIEGELRSSRYDKEGVTHYVTEVLCQQFNLLESKAAVALRENNVVSSADDVETLPF
ncbi:MAG: single-stranded DNA-binding protein [Lactococcus plantarum]|nr:single-stranded DNA-binding protein [Lactococcus plantarum]MDN6069564.1 single-stranded DNA-binding protein [Lactococcus plantarum]MDN6084175.1 single-stranded DNA-binding protein [Lactococcus plantarum]